MPTGTPIPDIRDQLFDCAERILVRGGPDAVTSRAVTMEAGVAKGIMHRHFADFDTFLAAFVLREIERLEAWNAQLRASAGRAGLIDTIADALARALNPTTLAIVALVSSRHRLLYRLRLTTPAGIPLLAEATTQLASYLTAERGLGRIALEVDVDTLAVTLVGGAYLLRAGRDTAPPDLDDLRELVTASLDGFVRRQAHGRSAPPQTP